MNDTMTGITAPGLGSLRGKIRRGMVTALMLAAIVGGALLPVNSAQAHFDYCGKEEYEYSVYFKEVYREEKEEGGKRWHYYDYYYRYPETAEWQYIYSEWKDCSASYP